MANDSCAMDTDTQRRPHLQTFLRSSPMALLRLWTSETTYERRVKGDEQRQQVEFGRDPLLKLLTIN